MNNILYRKFLPIFMLIFLLSSTTLCACGADNQGNSDSNVSSGQKGSWDNTPKVLVPEATGEDVGSNDTVTIDSSNSSEGYICITYSGTNEKVKLQITGPDSITYTYNLIDNSGVFPLTSGSGSYTAEVYENLSGNQYILAYSRNINVSISNPLKPFLYPNQYSNFTKNSIVVSTGSDLSYSADSALNVVENVYNYIIKNISYDYDKAKTVNKGYIPDVDEIMQTKKGICFDYASVMTAMLRSQNIPTRLEVGYRGEEYHAWISVYIEGSGWINGVIQFNQNEWKLMDPTYASTSKAPEKFIPENSMYNTKYIY